ncbi:MAG: VWA domain-containing protein [Myxococcota bacterium]
MIVGIALYSLSGCPAPEELHVTEPSGRSEARVTAPVEVSTPPGRAPVVEQALPSGELVVRDCDGSLGLAPRPGGGLGWVSAIGCASAERAPAPPVTTSADVPAEPRIVAGAPAAEPAAMPDPAPPPAPAPSSGEENRRRNVADAERGPVKVDQEAADDTLARKTFKDAKFRWGGEQFLSNDDSMSLASAQRVLWALAHDARLDPSQIRKHELLNYFSFDTVAPQPGRTFGVHGAAEREGDQLTVALAVRGANPPRQPLDLTVVVDRSGSMKAEGKMDFTRRGLHQLVAGLQRGDRVDLVLFDDRVCTPVEGFVVGRDPVDVLTNAIDAIQPRGSTDLAAGLDEAYRIQAGREPADTHGRSRRVLVVTDAQLNSGNVDRSLVSEVGRQLDQHDIRLSGVGVGRDFDDEMLDLLTEKGRGAYVFLGSEAVVDRVFGVGLDGLIGTVANDVRFSLDLPPSLAMAKFYGEESSSVAADVKPVHFHAGTTQLFLQDLQIRDGELSPSDPIALKIAYRDPATDEPVTEELRTTVGALLDADPHNVRKGRALMAFADWALAEATDAGSCGEPRAPFRSRAASVADDAEIGYVNGLVGAVCGEEPLAVAVAPVELKVKLDTDVPVTGVDVDCGADGIVRRQLQAGDTVARFDVAPGECRVQIHGTLPMSASLSVPTTGLDVWCRVRGGRLSCG